MTVKLIIGELRKEMGISQQDLAEHLKVSFQAVSKWETGNTMPDITLLPEIAQFFNVSVDALLGLVPLRHTKYISRNTDDRDSWNNKSEGIHSNRKYLWNDDYLRFLVDQVWGITTPVNIIDFRCGNGYLGMKLMDLLPRGSTYTGLDSVHFLNEAKLAFQQTNHEARFIQSDLYSFDEENKYDLAICQAGLRHLSKPLEIMSIMRQSVKTNGLVVCVEVNREFENAGLFLNGVDYEYLCTGFDFHGLWQREFENEGRDYAIGMKLPHYMKQIGLLDIEVRMDDRVLFVEPDMQNYGSVVENIIRNNGWHKTLESSEKEGIVEMFMSRGYNRYDAEGYIRRHNVLVSYFNENRSNLSFTKASGLMMACGRK